MRDLQQVTTLVRQRGRGTGRHRGRNVDHLYPQLRPARVTVITARGSFTRQAEEALGSRIVPLDDPRLKAKFLDLVGPVLGTARANELAQALWSIDAIRDVAPLVGSMARPA